MRLFRVHEQWYGEVFLITAIDKERALQIMDTAHVASLTRMKEDTVRHRGNPSSIIEFLTNRVYRHSMYVIEEIEGDITKEGIVDSYVYQD